MDSCEYKTLRVSETFDDPMDASEARDKYIKKVRGMIGVCKVTSIHDHDNDVLVKIAWHKGMPFAVLLESCNDDNNFVLTGTTFYIP